MSQVVATDPEPRPAQGARWLNLTQFGDRFTRHLCQGAAISVILLAVVLVIVIFWQAWLSIETNGVSFFTQKTWAPQEEHRIFGSLAFVYGTLASSALAMLIAVPLGVGTAAFLSEIAPPWLRRPGSFLVEMLAAVPSVVYGFWGMYVLGPSLQKFVGAMGGPNFGGVGILPAGIILAIMIVPYVTAVSFDVCRAVPISQREAALALGATRWQTIWSVVLPYARPGIVGACFLALGRALGETMAVTMLIGNSTNIEFSLFAKGDTIASVIANQFTEATYDLYLSALVELALVLLVVTIIVNSLARLLIWRVGRFGTAVSSGKSSTAVEAPPAAIGSLPHNGHPTPRAPHASPDGPPATHQTPPMAHWMNRGMTVVLCGCLAATLIPLFLILGYLIYRGIGGLSWDFFFNLPVAMGEPHGGMANALIGSAMLVGAATILAVPVGLLAAIYLTEYRDRTLAPTVRFIGELLAGVPSIVIGIFAYTLIIPPYTAGGTPGWYGWAGVFALAIMMVPIVMRASEESLKLVPPSLREASYALGANQWQTLVRVIVPAALPAIITGVFLAIARIVGETAPLLLTAGNNRFWPRSLNDYTPSLPLYIYLYATSADDEWHQQAWAAALVLLTIVMLLNFGIRFLTANKMVSGTNK